MSKSYKRKLHTLLALIEDTSNSLLNSTKPLEHRIFKAEGVEEYGRHFGNIIHDMPAIWSGYASPACILSKLDNSKFEVSADHYNSRQRCGEEIAILIKKTFGNGRAPTQKEIERIVSKARKVHYVLKEENQRVRKFMAQQMTPKAAYKAAGIKLHEARELFGKLGRPSKAWKEKMEKKYRPNPLQLVTKNVKLKP